VAKRRAQKQPARQQQPTQFAFRAGDPRGARSRLVWAVGIGALSWLVIPSAWALAVRLLVAWDVAAVVLLAIAGGMIASSSAPETGRRAAADDPGRTAVWAIVLLGSAFSVFGATVVMRTAAADSGLGGGELLALCAGTVLVSWLLTHASFTLRYAHLFYRTSAGEDAGGLEFPGGDRPDDLDFAYFAFTVGMCFQVSDVTVSARLIRRTVLAHSMLSFAYNTVIIALVMNLVVGHLS
jgi:uncharacterized membrane protein